ncbi:hypothetical protein C9374_013435 [Naegleria lovaniensis]|uniref:Actin n=1 Tax=Naegleria lovaniensis TaxID=51637 RepID=A0AA88GZ96_NAELO|nr:uncharacterized protein C9374_013435 [Naegleria lovaniensis]KAG2391950.1 hypothetical protein C9374_013435 [Naegleria lovaniensis]
MKHSICKVSKRKLSECFDAGQGILEEEEAEYELPDGSVLKIGNERFECCEMLFDPTPFPSAGSQENDTNISSLSELAYNCIMKNSDEYRKDLFKDVVLSGGSFMIDGSAERMENDMKHFALSGYRVNVVTNSQRVYSSWTGAAILSQRSVDKDKWVSKVQYEEHGSNLRK